MERCRTDGWEGSGEVRRSPAMRGIRSYLQRVTPLEHTCTHIAYTCVYIGSRRLYKMLTTCIYTCSTTIYLDIVHVYMYMSTQSIETGCL